MRPGILYPTKCVLCQRLMDGAEPALCPQCARDTEAFPDRGTSYPHLEKVVSLWYYTGNVRKSILRFKFSRRRNYARTYGKLLAAKLRRLEVSFDVLTWAPISFPRLLKRTYDQSRLLANALGKELGVPPQRTLFRVRHTGAQSLLKTAAQRRANVLGAYRLVRPEQFRGKRVLLLDDVVTTGATAGECARMLLTAGAKSVTLAVLAAPSQTKQQ